MSKIFWWRSLVYLPGQESRRQGLRKVGQGDMNATYGTLDESQGHKDVQ